MDNFSPQATERSALRAEIQQIETNQTNRKKRFERFEKICKISRRRRLKEVHYVQKSNKSKQIKQIERKRFERFEKICKISRRRRLKEVHYVQKSNKSKQIKQIEKRDLKDLKRFARFLAAGDPETQTETTNQLKHQQYDKERIFIGAGADAHGCGRRLGARKHNAGEPDDDPEPMVAHHAGGECDADGDLLRAVPAGQHPAGLAGEGERLELERLAEDLHRGQPADALHRRHQRDGQRGAPPARQPQGRHQERAAGGTGGPGSLWADARPRDRDGGHYR
ncbi:MAG: hypothetical protein IJU90_04210 [Bacteroidales bacterium]|nr:hypothetical protein [Bacteroidales bacterium]